VKGILRNDPEQAHPSLHGGQAAMRKTNVFLAALGVGVACLGGGVDTKLKQ
jgi:hypothetical protein